MKKLFALTALSCVLFSCQKEVTFDSPSSGGGGGGTSGGVSNTYQPMSKNSYWKYHETGTFSGDFTLTSTGTQRTINGITYTVFSAAPATTLSEELFAIDHHNMYAYFEGIAPGSTATLNINMLYSNDTASVGYTWDNLAGQANGITAYTPGTILEKGVSLTVGGKSYNNVIHSQIQLEYDFPLVGRMPAIAYDYYVAKGVGVIRIESTGDAILAPGVHTIADLTEYSIK